LLVLILIFLIINFR